MTKKYIIKYISGKDFSKKCDLIEASDKKEAKILFKEIHPKGMVTKIKLISQRQLDKESDEYYEQCQNIP